MTWHFGQAAALFSNFSPSFPREQGSGIYTHTTPTLERADGTQHFILRHALPVLNYPQEWKLDRHLGAGPLLPAVR